MQPCSSIGARRRVAVVLLTVAAALSAPGRAADRQAIEQVIDDIAPPELLSATLSSGTLELGFMGCSGSALDGARTAGISFASVEVNTRTLQAVASIASPIGNFTATGSIDTNGDFQGSWQGTGLRNPGTTLDASGGFDTALSGSAMLSGDFSTISFSDARVYGASAECSTVEVSVSGTLTVDTGSAASVELTQSRTLSTFVNSLVTILPKRIAARLSRGTQAGSGFSRLPDGAMVEGVAAGDLAGYPWGAWASYQRSDSEDSLAVSAFDSTSDLVFAGVDIVPWDNVVVGVAFGYEDTDTDTLFNGGRQEQTGVSVIPYMGVALGESMGVDFDVGFDLAFGYSSLQSDQVRTFAGAPISSEFDSRRVFANGNVSIGRAFGALYVSGLAGVLFATDTTDRFTEFNANGTVNRVVGRRKIKLGRASIGGDVALALGDFEPFAGALYQIDYTRFDFRQAQDNDEVLVNAGFRWRRDNLTASLQWSTVLARDNFDSDTLNFTFRADF